jgi:hypothetical protein
MRNRYKPIAIVAGVLFLINLIVRLLGHTVFHKSDNDQITSGIVFIVAIAVIMAVAAYWWSVRYPMARTLPELGLILAVACLASVLIGPFAAASYPFREGAGLFFSEVWHFLGFGIGGAVFGLLIAMAFGQDYRAKALKRYSETAMARPRRVVRR